MEVFVGKGEVGNAYYRPSRAEATDRQTWVMPVSGRYMGLMSPVSHTEVHPCRGEKVANQETFGHHAVCETFGHHAVCDAGSASITVGKPTAVSLRSCMTLACSSLAEAVIAPDSFMLQASSNEPSQRLLKQFPKAPGSCCLDNLDV